MIIDVYSVSEELIQCGYTEYTCLNNNSYQYIVLFLAKLSHFSYYWKIKYVLKNI